MSEQKDDSLLTKAARAIGSAAGKVASTVESVTHRGAAPVARAGKLPKKNKQRLPRKQKKAMQKAAAKSKARSA